jgi:hypothetical protein
MKMSLSLEQYIAIEQGVVKSITSKALEMRVPEIQNFLLNNAASFWARFGKLDPTDAGLKHPRLSRDLDRILSDWAELFNEAQLGDPGKTSACPLVGVQKTLVDIVTKASARDGGIPLPRVHPSKEARPS